MTDRRRINGPPSGTTPLTFSPSTTPSQPPTRTRRPDQHRKLFLRTGLTLSASGSAYLELAPSTPSPSHSLTSQSSTLKLSCTVHGPKPLPRSAPFSPHLVLSTHVKFAPYATRNNRRGPLRDAGERDLGVHLETALRGVVIGDRWPKSGVDVSITVLEAEEDASDGGGDAGVSGAGMMSVLAGCITVASAALVEAGIDCVDTVTGGVAAIVSGDSSSRLLVVDPCPAEHETVVAACVVGYLQSRDEVTELWMKGDVGAEVDGLLCAAVEGAKASRLVLAEVLKESMAAKVTARGEDAAKGKGRALDDVQMTG